MPQKNSQKTNRKTGKTESLNPGDCISYRLRRAARIAAKRFDDALRPAGLRNTQFTLLAALQDLGATSIGALASELATDSTTLTRNLDVLLRRGLVEDIPMEDGRIRAVRLTAEGQAVFEKALPLWRGMQAELLEVLAGERWPQMMSELADIEKACGTGD